MSQLRRVALHILLPIGVGACIYVLWRDRGLWVFDWLRAAGLDAAVEAARTVAAPAAGWLPGWWLHSLPDGLWVYAVTAAGLLTWRDSGSRLARWTWSSLGLVLGAGSELGQALALVPGTFDLIDLALCVLAAASAALFIKTQDLTHTLQENTP